jgi:hypothetical protein
MTVLIPTIACLIALGSLGGGLLIGGLTAIAHYRRDRRVDQLESRVARLTRITEDLYVAGVPQRRSIERELERWSDLINRHPESRES